MKTVIITGALGFIGSHTCKAFKNAGYYVIGIDRNVFVPSGTKYVDEYIKDDFETMASFCAVNKQAEAIIHLGATSLVGPSMSNPGLYYNNNVAKTNSMLQQLADAKWKGGIVFSSSAAIYGNDDFDDPWKEKDRKNPISPYGRSKLMCEQIIKDHCIAHGFKAIALRYFNACGCDPDNELGNTKDDTHLVPRVVSSLITKQRLVINGNDFETEDGTCIRDYLHVTDIANAHVKSVEMLATQEKPYRPFNLGTGKGYSNLDIIKEVEKVSGEKITYNFGPRREGDPAKLIANPNKFMKNSDWEPRHSDLHTIVKTTIDWMKEIDYTIE
jgi:UDP-glucose-4-epimerase GalE